MIVETVAWVLFSGFSHLFNSIKGIKESNFFKEIVIQNIKFGVLIEFLVNLYSFPFFIEAIVAPLLIYFIIINAFSKTKVKNQLLFKFSSYILVLYAIGIITTSGFNAFNQINSDNIHLYTYQLVFPLLLALLYLPFLYSLVLFMAYESFLKRIKFAIKDLSLYRKIRLDILIWGNIRLRRIRRISKDFHITRINSFEEYQLLKTAFHEFPK
jgi:hypothetical protein